MSAIDNKKSDGSTISDIDYTLDACGRVTEKDEYNVGDTDYTYDAEGQLTEVSYPSSRTDDFTYDNNGNRTEWTRSDAATTTYKYNAGDELTKSTEGTLGTSYGYDDNGNMTGQTTSNVTKTFSYDSFDRMTSAVQGDTTLQSMTYGPDGKRLSLTDTSGTHKFFYDGDNVIQEYNSNWSAVTKEYTHGPWVDEPLSMTEHTTGQPNSTYYLMKDRLGSIINILDKDETLKTTYSYDAFGEPTTTYNSGQIDCAYRFAGREYDSGMGNYFNRARYYNQSLGRFFSRDPIMSLGSLYAYCNNSPTNFTDPGGMLSSPISGSSPIMADFPRDPLWLIRHACTGKGDTVIIDGEIYTSTGEVLPDGSELFVADDGSAVFVGADGSITPCSADQTGGTGDAAQQEGGNAPPEGFESWDQYYQSQYDHEMEGYDAIREKQLQDYYIDMVIEAVKDGIRERDRWNDEHPLFSPGTSTPGPHQCVASGLMLGCLNNSRFFTEIQDYGNRCCPCTRDMR